MTMPKVGDRILVIKGDGQPRIGEVVQVYDSTNIKDEKHNKVVFKEESSGQMDIADIQLDRVMLLTPVRAATAAPPPTIADKKTKKDANIYQAKEDLYRDFDVAVKFELAHRLGHKSYESIFKAFSTECQLKLASWPNHPRNNYNSTDSVLACFFVEKEVLDDAGGLMATEFVLVEHETGWELFLEALKDESIKSAGKTVASLVVGAVLPSVISFVKNRWKLFIDGGVEIKHVEIRTKQKGIKRIKFSDFEYNHLACLLHHFHEMTHMDQALQSSGRTINEECFERKLYDAP